MYGLFIEGAPKREHTPSEILPVFKYLKEPENYMPILVNMILDMIGCYQFPELRHQSADMKARREFLTNKAFEQSFSDIKRESEDTYYALENGLGFVTPAEAAKKLAPKDIVSVPFPMTWAGEAKDLSIYAGNDLQQEAINKLYAVAERVHLCSDKRLKRDWLMLQDLNYLHFMNHIDQGATNYESAYDAFINYMNVLSDFLQLVEEQYPTTIENEELNSLLKTINGQEKEIARLEKELKESKKAKK